MEGPAGEEEKPADISEGEIIGKIKSTRRKKVTSNTEHIEVDADDLPQAVSNLTVTSAREKK